MFWIMLIQPGKLENPIHHTPIPLLPFHIKESTLGNNRDKPGRINGLPIIQEPTSSPASATLLNRIQLRDQLLGDLGSASLACKDFLEVSAGKLGTLGA